MIMMRHFITFTEFVYTQENILTFTAILDTILYYVYKYIYMYTFNIINLGKTDKPIVQKAPV